MLYSNIYQANMKQTFSFNPTFALCLTCLPASVAFADAPKVVTDIAPVHSLVAQVMEGVGTPQLLIEASASPHSYSLRPSQATALGSADAVFWVGHELTPWLEKSIDTLANNAQVVSLLNAPETMTLEVRESEEDHHGHEDEEHDDHKEHDDHEEHAEHEEDGHDDHKEHDDHEEHAEHEEDGHDDHEEHAEHEEEGHDDHHGHAHEGTDPHAWLDPLNGIVWLNAIATELSKIDPENAETYQANAEKRAAALQSQVSEIKAASPAISASTDRQYLCGLHLFRTAVQQRACEYRHRRHLCKSSYIGSTGRRI